MAYISGEPTSHQPSDNTKYMAHDSGHTVNCGRVFAKTRPRIIGQRTTQSLHSVRVELRGTDDGRTSNCIPRRGAEEVDLWIVKSTTCTTLFPSSSSSTSSILCRDNTCTWGVVASSIQTDWSSKMKRSKLRVRERKSLL